MKTEEKSYGALIGSIVIIVILVIGGVYAWQSRIKDMQMKQKLQQEANAIAAEELNNLQEDANTTDVTIDINSEDIK
ncbi:MAG: hypothetical protein WCI41_01350 [bacterium]